MVESIMLNKAKDFAVEIVNVCKYIKETKRESVLTNHLRANQTHAHFLYQHNKGAHNMTCYLLRHGKDDDTLRGGWSDAPLTAEIIKLDF